jgi:hypothetical protein
MVPEISRSRKTKLPAKKTTMRPDASRAVHRKAPKPPHIDTENGRFALPRQD